MANLDLLLKLGFRFSPSPEEVVTFYMPRLIVGQQPRDTEGCIHRANVYGAEPKNLAGEFAPVARSSNGDRFFSTHCKRIKGRVSRAAGGGTWVSQSSKDIKNREGIKVGETKNFRFKKDGKNTDWLMEEYHLCHQEADDLEPVVCRMYVSPRAAQDSAARQESTALRTQEPASQLPPAPAAAAPPLQEETLITQQAPQKSPPTVAAPPCAKKMGGAVSESPVVHQSCVTASSPPPRCIPPPSRRVMAPAPPDPPVQTYPKDPFEPPRPACAAQRQAPPLPTASVTGGHHTPQPAPQLAPAPAAIAQPRQEAVITRQQVPLKRPAPVTEPPCFKKMRCSVYANAVAHQNSLTSSAPPPRCVPRRPTPPSGRVMAAKPPHPPIETNPTDPFEPPPPLLPTALVTGRFHAPEPSVPAMLEPPANDNKLQDEFLRSLDEEILRNQREHESKRKQLKDEPSPNHWNDDHLDEFSKSLEHELEEIDGDEISVPVAPLVVQIIMPNDEISEKQLKHEPAPCHWNDDDLDEFTKLLEHELEAVDGDEICDEIRETDGEYMDEFINFVEHKLERGMGKDSERDDMDEFARQEEQGTLSRSTEEENKVQEAFDVLKGIDADGIDEGYLKIPLKDYGDKLFF